jgi:hypothetical protein
LRRFVAALQALEDLTQVVAVHRTVGPQRYGTLHELERVVQVPGLQRDDAEQVQRVGVLGLALQNAPVALLRLRQAAGSVQLERDGELAL